MKLLLSLVLLIAVCEAGRTQTADGDEPPRDEKGRIKYKTIPYDTVITIVYPEGVTAVYNIKTLTVAELISLLRLKEPLDAFDNSHHSPYTNWCLTVNSKYSLDIYPAYTYQGIFPYDLFENEMCFEDTYGFKVSSVNLGCGRENIYTNMVIKVE